MSIKNARILFLISFIVGFFVSDSLHTFSEIGWRNRAEKIEREYTNDSLFREEVPFKILQVETPERAIRGNTFEFITYIKITGKVYDNYELIMIMVPVAKKEQPIINKYQILANEELKENSILKFGPVKFLIPESAWLGQYTMQVELYRETNAPEKKAIFFSEKRIIEIGIVN